MPGTKIKADEGTQSVFYFSDIFKKKKFWFSLGGLVVAVLILRNNWNMIAGGGKAGSNPAPAVEDEADSLFDGENEASHGLHPAIPSSEEPETEPADHVNPADVSQPKTDNFKQKRTSRTPDSKEKSYNRNPPTPHQSYVTESFICPLQSEPMLYILLQLELVYEDPALEKEILEKRDQMTAVVQNLIFTKEKTQLNADYLRREIKQALNGYLKRGNLADIIFKDFKLEVRKSK